MGELKFVIKSVILSVLLIMALQMKWKERTLEDHWEAWVRTSTVSNYLQQVAAGGAILIENAGKAGSDIFKKALGQKDKAKPTNSRLSTLAPQRSSQALQEQATAEEE